MVYTTCILHAALLYSKLAIILPTYFWRLTLLYSVSVEANCFLRFIKFVIALATPTLRISFCWSWTRVLFSELIVGSHLHVCECNEPKVAAHAQIIYYYYYVCGCSEFGSLLCTVYLIIKYKVHKIYVI